MHNTEVLHRIRNLFASRFDASISHIDMLPASGSSRLYYRVHSSLPYSVIACLGTNVDENKSFLYFADFFFSQGLAVPEIYAVEEGGMLYLLSDLGSLDVLQYKKTLSDSEVMDLYKRIIGDLLQFQFLGAQADFSHCFVRQSFDETAMKWDLSYFKYYYVKLSGIDCNDQKMEEDFDSVLAFLAKADAQYFMYRDFQARNILITDNSLRYIDFQGGMQGALQYDLVSLLFQAKAELSEDMRTELLEFYISELEKRISVNRQDFVDLYYGFALIRMLQTLGAYGLRGIVERKEHFIASIPAAVENVKTYIHKLPNTLAIPYLRACIKHLPTITI